MDKLISPIPSIETELFLGMGPLVKACQGLAKQGVIFCDENVARLHGACLQNHFLSQGFKIQMISFVPGERSKTRETKQALEDELFKRKLGRDTLFLALGGGVTTDLVGFLAATYMRGVPLILIPTTLLGMVDAAIGGKTAVDTPFGKNLVGAFYFPKAIFIDVQYLTTLPEREWQNGLAEMLKYGLIADDAIWERFEQSDWKEKKTLEELILRSIRAKGEVVEQDPEECGYRRVLNFGHTVGHALEWMSHYAISHGEAVATGCLAESFLSHQLGLLSKESFERIVKLYRKLGLSIRLPSPFQREVFLEAITIDKKARQAEPRFVLLDEIGYPAAFDGDYCSPVNPLYIDGMIDWMIQNNT